MEPVYRKEDGELMGFVRQSNEDKNLWEMLTVFGYKFGEMLDKDFAISQVESKGLALLTEKWEYFSEKDNEWKICLILEANPDYVKIQDGYYPDKDAEVFSFNSPSEDVLKLIK